MKTNKILALTLATLMLCTTLAACGDKPAPEDAPATTTDKVVFGGVEMNSIERASVENVIEDKTAEAANQFELKEFPSLSSMLLELDAGRIDVLAVGESIGNYLLSKDDKLLSVSPEGPPMRNYMGLRSEDSALRDKINAAIDALKADGTLDKLVDQYITNLSGDPTPTALNKKEGLETYIVGVTGDLPSMDFVSADGTPAGFNVALLNAIGENIGCNFEMVQMEATARLSALQSGRIDIVFWIRCGGEEQANADTDEICMTSSYFADPACLLTHSEETLKKLASLA